MEIEQLKMFAAVAECGSFTRAAERLYVSHSSTSRAVSALEEELGVRLLERDNKVIGLTEAGESVLIKARQLIALADELVTVGDGLDRSEKGKYGTAEKKTPAAERI